MPASRSPNGFLRNNVVVALGTATSRATGFLRLLVTGWALIEVLDGVADPRLAAAYDLANTTPNILFELVLGGILSATLVPIFTKALDDRDPDAANAVVSVATVALATLTVAATLAAPLVVQAYTFLAQEDVEAYRSVATDLARLLLPQIFFYGAMSMSAAMLHARRRFFAAAWSPVLTNLVIIATMVLVRQSFAEQPNLELAQRQTRLVWMLGLGTTAGVAVMAIVLIPALRRSGVRLRFNPDLRHPAVREVLRLSTWTAGYVIANQVALAVVTVLAQQDLDGFSSYRAMFVVFQLPHGLLAVTIMTTTTPELSSAFARGDLRRYRASLRTGLRLVVGLMLPAAVLMTVASDQVSGLIGRYGALRSAAPVLAAFGAGLVGYSVYLYLLRGFYAQRDTRTPFVLNLIENGINVVLAFVLIGPFGVRGLAWAFAIAYLLAALLAWVVLDRRVPGGLGGHLVLPGVVRALGAAVVMGLAVWLVVGRMGGERGLEAAATVAVASAIGLACYLLTLGGLGGMAPRRPRAPFGQR